MEREPDETKLMDNLLQKISALKIPQVSQSSVRNNYRNIEVLPTIYEEDKETMMEKEPIIEGFKKGRRKATNTKKRGVKTGRRHKRRNSSNKKNKLKKPVAKKARDIPEYMFISRAMYNFHDSLAHMDKSYNNDKQKTKEGVIDDTLIIKSQTQYFFRLLFGLAVFPVVMNYLEDEKLKEHIVNPLTVFINWLCFVTNNTCSREAFAEGYPILHRMISPFFIYFFPGMILFEFVFTFVLKIFLSLKNTVPTFLSKLGIASTGIDFNPSKFIFVFIVLAIVMLYSVYEVVEWMVADSVSVFQTRKASKMFYTLTMLGVLFVVLKNVSIFMANPREYLPKSYTDFIVSLIQFLLFDLPPFILALVLVPISQLCFVAYMIFLFNIRTFQNQKNVFLYDFAVQKRQFFSGGEEKGEETKEEIRQAEQIPKNDESETNKDDDSFLNKADKFIKTIFDYKVCILFLVFFGFCLSQALHKLKIKKIQYYSLSLSSVGLFFTLFYIMASYHKPDIFKSVYSGWELLPSYAWFTIIELAIISLYLF